MKIAIIGGGWVGKRLAKYLTERNHHVIVTTTTPDKIPELKTVAAEVHLLDFNEVSETDFLNDAEIAIFSMPISQNSWHQGFESISNVFPKTILFSSTGIYPQQNRIFTENDTDHLRTDILNSEMKVLKKYPQTIILRLGGLMGDERSLKNFFNNKKVPQPEKLVNYIHYEDILASIDLLLHSDKPAGIYNLVAPEHPSMGEILNIEDKNTMFKTDLPLQRIISSELFVHEFGYTFIHPNPKCF